MGAAGRWLGTWTCVCVAFGCSPTHMCCCRYIVVANVFVIGSTSVYAVFRFVGAMMCVLLSMVIKARQFASSTQLRNDRDVVVWHEQFAQLQRQISFVSVTMLQWPLVIIIVMALGLLLGLFSYTFVSSTIFNQPFFYELLIVTGLLTAATIALLLLAAQVPPPHPRLLLGRTDVPERNRTYMAGVPCTRSARKYGWC